jgi:REP element-mobilizing transposase RayT
MPYLKATTIDITLYMDVQHTKTIGSFHVQADHMHLYLSVPPPVAPSRIAHTLTGTTGGPVLQCFHERNSFGMVPTGLVLTMWVVLEV